MTQDVRRYMALTERAIAAAFVNDGLQIHLLHGTQGPHTLTYALKLYQSTKANLAKALKLGPAIEAAIGDGPVRVYSDRGILHVEVPSPMPLILRGDRLRGEGLAVPLGMDGRRAIVGIDFETSPHVLLVGPTNAGKTTAARLIAYQLALQNPARACRFIVSTFKPKDWAALAAVAHTFAVIVEPEESAQMVRYLVDVMYNRTKTGQDRPHLFVFLDDLLNLLGVAPIESELAQLASLGRSAGIHLIVGTQRLGELGAGGAAITGNIRTRVVFGTADAQDAAQFTGRGGSGAESLGRYKGDALLIVEGIVRRLAVATVDDADLATLPQNPDDWRPWRSVSPASQSATTYLPAVSRDGEGDDFDKKMWASDVSSRGMTLANRPPNAEESADLRERFAHLGSRRAVLREAWGGVVNAEGNTPKTRRWLNEALAEVPECGKH